MSSILTLLTISTAIVRIMLAGSALNSRFDLKRVFFTHEQKTKAYFYNLLILLGLFSFSITFFAILANGFTERNERIPEENLILAISLWITLFIFFMIFLGFAVRMNDNLFIKNHYKYKVSLPEIGEVYILSMLNEDICICSTDTNIIFRPSDDKSFLIEKTL